MKRLPQCWSSNGYCPQWVAGVVAWPHTRQLWSTQGPFSVAMLPPGLPPMPGHTETVGWRAAVGRAGLVTPDVVSAHQNMKLKGRFFHHLCEILISRLFSILKINFIVLKCLGPDSAALTCTYFYRPGCCSQTQWSRGRFVEGLRVLLWW